MSNVFAQARILLAGCILVIALAMAGCASIRSPAIDAPPESLRSIFVVRRGWHTGIAVPTRDWPNPDWTLLRDFPDADYLEFGWGDKRYYQSEPATSWQGSRAALWPTASVVHVIGLRQPVSEHALALDIVEVRIPVERLHRVANAIEQEFAHDTPAPTGSTLRAAPEPNRFYEGRRRFYFPRMCNWWAASRLREAGCLVTPATTIFAARVMKDARVCAARRHLAPE